MHCAVLPEAIELELMDEKNWIVHLLIVIKFKYVLGWNARETIRERLSSIHKDYILLMYTGLYIFFSFFEFDWVHAALRLLYSKWLIRHFTF